MANVRGYTYMKNGKRIMVPSHVRGVGGGGSLAMMRGRKRSAMSLLSESHRRFGADLVGKAEFLRNQPRGGDALSLLRNGRL